MAGSGKPAPPFLCFAPFFSVPVTACGGSASFPLHVTGSRSILSLQHTREVIMADTHKRNLVVCCDGTWNTPDQKDRDRIAPTNVVKMARAVLTKRDGLSAEIEEQGVTIVPQAVFYDTGLGTGENDYGPDQTPESGGWGSKFSSAFDSLKSGGKNTGLKDRLLEAVDKLAGGAGGLGMSDKIKDAYRWLCDNYKEGDQIFLFGFSRGAYTVRSLSGLIDLCGLVPAHDEEALEEAWDLSLARR
ncbi:MAG: DUF2235 domain-containing protein [Proteobacteria bacterium]|nr:DUF2235 domain-containing protein [Pseudomonadota bacterium]